VRGLVITGVAAIVNVCAFDVPPHGVTTVIDAVPAVAIRAAGTVAVSCVDETNVVANAVPFQFTVEIAAKFVPFTVKVNCGPPAVAQVGLRELIVGVALIVNVTAFDGWPLEFLTVTCAVPGVAIFAAGTIAVSRVADTNVVARFEPFHLTIEVLS
jgi:hypothetical protein